MPEEEWSVGCLWKAAAASFVPIKNLGLNHIKDEDEMTAIKPMENVADKSGAQITRIKHLE